MITVTSNNYYINEYARLINRITLDDEHIDNLVERIALKAETAKADNKKQIAFVAAAVAVAALGAKFLLDVNKKK